jgi:hypothetical protein
VSGNSSPAADALFFFFDLTLISDYVGGNVGIQSVSFLPPQEYDVVSNAAHSFSFVFRAVSTAAVPEPSTFTLLGLGCAALAGYGWRRRGRPLA